MKENFSIERVLHLHRVKSPYFKKLGCLARTQKHDFRNIDSVVKNDQNPKSCKKSQTIECI